jgi:hypothetical protein
VFIGFERCALPNPQSEIQNPQSDGAFALQNNPDRLEQNLDIINEAPVVQVAAVQLHYPVKVGDLVAARSNIFIKYD